jgi:hypothetical protein
MHWLRNACRARTVLTLLAALTASNAAFSSDKLYAPYVTKGELELEYFGNATVDDQGSKDNAQTHEFSLGYGVNDFWFTEIYANFAKDPQDNVTFDNVEWENIFQLTEPGQYWLDVGASLAYEWSPKTSEADTIEGRLLFAKDIEKTSHILNLVGEKDVGSGPKAAFEAKALWSSRYRYAQAFEPGFEILSDFGELKDAGSFNDQKHAIGPTAYGKIPLGLTTEHADAMK